MSLLIAIVVLLAILVYLFVVNTYSYWKQRNVPQADLWTTLGDVFKAPLKLETFLDTWTNVYGRNKQHRCFGTYQIFAPLLVVRDQELIKSIAVKDFDHFTDHRDLASSEADPFWSRNIFALHGSKWRAMRATLSPTFTGSKMRSMFTLIDEAAKKYVDHYKQGPRQFTLEFKDSFTRLSNDIIASAAFGIQCDSLKERNNEFYLMGKEATNFGGVRNTIKFLLALSAPKIATFFKVQFFSSNVRRFFGDLVPRTIKIREEQNIQRPDMIHLLMEARKGLLKVEEEANPTDGGFAVLEDSQFEKNEKLRLTELTDDDITAQAVLFITGGFDTIATALCFAAYELAVNADIQEKLRLEIEDQLSANDGNLSYDIITKMKYMDMVISEVLRKWPPALVSDRVCTKPYTIASTNATEADIEIKPGETVLIPIIGIHRDADIYPEPEVFNPERFNDENKHLLTPYNYLPFGVGPRHCIAIRFALMEVKTVLAHLLINFDIIPVERTEIPMKLSTSTLSLNAENGFWFGLKRRNEINK